MNMNKFIQSGIENSILLIKVSVFSFKVKKTKIPAKKLLHLIPHLTYSIARITSYFKGRFALQKSFKQKKFQRL